MDGVAVNEELNNIKDRFPEETALVESVQKLFNKEVQIISDRSIRALKAFPMQFTKRIPTADGEWTTQLHIWADNQVAELLDIDPLVLTARNSDGECVLMSLLMAATGRFTQQVNYPLIQKILDKDMQFQYLTEPGDESSVQTGNVWDEEDLDHKTPLEYLADFAKGTGVFGGCGQDPLVRQMLENFADRPEPDNGPGKPLSDPNFDEDQAKKAIEQSEAKLDTTAETNPQNIPTADQIVQQQEQAQQPAAPAAPAQPVQQAAPQPQPAVQQPAPQAQPAPVQAPAPAPAPVQAPAPEPAPAEEPTQSVRERCKQILESNPTVNDPDAAPIAGSKKLLEALVTIGKNTIDFS